MKRFVPRLGALVLVAVLVGAVVWLRPEPPRPAPVPPKEVVLQYADGTRLWGSRDGGPRPDLVRRLVAALDEAGTSLEQLEPAGAVVRTTVDVKAQTAAAAAVGRLAAPKGLGAAVTAVDPESGGVRTYLNLDRLKDLAGGESVALGPELTRPFTEAGLTTLTQPRMRLLDVTAAYAALAAGGVQRRTHFITSVTAADGSVLYRVIGVADLAVDPAVAERITARLKENNGCGGTACVLAASPWAAGHTPELAVGVFVDEAGGAVDTDLSRTIWQEFLTGLGR
ncbi:hypothetical protein BBK82_11440 [Lentzea guizhouensis]|uniref:Uncharacterized protein n=1 Tax=Lentzea guizhouensis TaxID=1586287 RepID=A0A1B2HFU2_9PSEU|nr:hypothetical protein [Lentzea guizhouensis]ANZ36587.1 hypothetical protein BBK82_11440 [Lentzea guizhouensis]